MTKPLIDTKLAVTVKCPFCDNEDDVPISFFNNSIYRASLICSLCDDEYYYRLTGEDLDRMLLIQKQEMEK
ncbi:hypothetical protein [Desulfovibrio litoralis]|uniref:Uncharacterized protein n=1 Tax=Desulfovibrio litoralis DSM 11393 TaxID=1121455 RepID=A0A1M7T7I9_9BACT|nr:hypothetical protein [Desulfovibrio litoralis]SHN66679.1 hypothetical protein SAMN02745728_01674 [Desulfovibrio litoralis DSM 11393]